MAVTDLAPAMDENRHSATIRLVLLLAHGNRARRPPMALPASPVFGCRWAVRRRPPVGLDVDLEVQSVAVSDRYWDSGCPRAADDRHDPASLARREAVIRARRLRPLRTA